MRTYIVLENIELYAYHGVFPQENLVGNNFVVNIKIEADISEACVSDRLDDTLNYGEIYAAIKDEMDIPSQLLEHVGGRIIRSLKKKFKGIKTIELKIAKKNPPTGGQMESAGIILID